MATRAHIRIGISGWTYVPWRGTFFPEGLPQKNELNYASRVLNVIEVNGTFYGLQKPASFERWAEATPEHFMFTVKAPRFITHIKRAREVATPVSNFLASGLLKLGSKLGPILWQFPPSFRFDAKLIEDFLKLLPHDTAQAAHAAAKHDSQLANVWTKTDEERPMRHAIEIRHESFRTPEFIDLLREHDVALVCADTVEWPRLMDLTSDFVYCRLHGSTELYRSGYDDEALDRWAARVELWSTGKEMADGEFAGSPGKAKKRDVFLFFDNTDKIKAPYNAQALMERLGVVVPEAV